MCKSDQGLRSLKKRAPGAMDWLTCFSSPTMPGAVFTSVQFGAERLGDS